MRLDIEDSWKKFETTGKVEDYLHYIDATQSVCRNDTPMPENQKNTADCTIK